jgi:hypothetical protein
VFHQINTRKNRISVRTMSTYMVRPNPEAKAARKLRACSVPTLPARQQLLPGAALALAQSLPDLELSTFEGSHDADAGFLRIRSREAGHKATFSNDVLNPVQRQQAGGAGLVTFDRHEVVGHGRGSLLPQPGGFEGLVSVLIRHAFTGGPGNPR